MLIVGPEICNCTTCKHKKCRTDARCYGIVFREEFAQAWLEDSAKRLVDDAAKYGFVATVTPQPPPAAPQVGEREQFEVWWRSSEFSASVFPLKTTHQLLQIGWQAHAALAAPPQAALHAVLVEARDALVYHQAQTRPIERTVAAIASIERTLSQTQEPT